MTPDEISDVAPAIVEHDRVEAWRLRVLLDAGYPLHLAERMARSDDVDLHQAVKLVERGCKPRLAAEILL